MNKIVVPHSGAISDAHRKSGAQNLVRSITKMVVKILLSVLVWAILIASFFVL